MLEAKKIAYRYREYTEEPLSAREIGEVLRKLGLQPQDVLRRNDKAFNEAGLTGNETAKQLIEAMAEYPTLLQRPIGVRGAKAVVGRPPENLLSL